MSEPSDKRLKVGPDLSLSSMQQMTNAVGQMSQNPDSDAMRYRKYLNEVMFTFDNDVDRLFQIMNCIGRCMEAFPQIFVATSSFDQNEAFKRKKQLCVAFSRWVISQLVLLLSKRFLREREDCKERCIEVLVSLLKLQKLKDVTIFVKIACDFVTFAEVLRDTKGKLSQISKVSPSSSKIELSLFPIEPKDGFVVDETSLLNLGSTSLFFESVDDCDHLQVVTLKVLIHILQDVVQCAPRCTDLLWLIFCDDLECGGSNLKEFALKGLSTLNEHAGGVSQNPQIARHVHNCIVYAALSVFSLNEAARNDSFDAAIVSAVRNICDNSCWTYFVTISDILNRIIQSLLASKVSLLQKLVVQLLIDIASQVPPSVETSSALRRCVLLLIGHKNTSKWVSRLLYSVIKRELHEDKQMKPTGDTQHAAASPSGTVDDCIVEATPTWKILSKYWRSFASGIQEDASSLLSTLYVSCQMMELLILLLNDGHKLKVENIVTQGWSKWNPVIKNSTCWTEEDLVTLYIVVIRYVTGLLDPQIVPFVNENMSSYLTGLLSLPWISSFSESEYPAGVYQVLIKISLKFRSSLVAQQISEALMLFLAFPSSSISISLRVQLMQKSLESLDSCIQKSAVHVLPVMLYFLGKEHFFRFEHSMRAIINSDVLSVTKELAVNFASLICTFSGTNKNLRPHCSFCNSSHYTCNNSDAIVDDAKIVNQVHILGALLVNHSSPEIRLAFAHDLDHILGHLGNDWKIADTCLKFLEDDSYDVRLAFSKHMGRYISVLRASGNNLEVFLPRIKNVFVTSKRLGRWRVVETIILSLGQLGKLGDGELLFVVVIILVENLFSTVRLVSSTCSLQLKQIAESKRMSVHDLFIRFCKPIGKFLANSLFEAENRGDSGPVEILNVVMKVFSFSDATLLIETIMPHLIPHLVCKASRETTSLIQSLAKYTKGNWRKLLVDNFKYIFSHLVCYCTRPELEASLEYIQKETEMKFGTLFRCDSQRIINELLLQIGSKYEQVFSGLIILASTDESLMASKTISHLNEVADFLQPRFLGFLVFFDALMQNSRVLLEEKHMALKSLTRVITLMGTKYIGSVRMKVMTTLRLTLRFKDQKFLCVCCQAWDAFIRTLDISVVGSMLSHIVVTILPLLISCEQEVAPTMNYLFVENREFLKDNFHDLYFIPKVPGLVKVYSAIKEQEGSASSSSQTDLNSLLLHSCRVIGNENVDVRLYALRNLRRLLEERQADVRAFILSRDSVDPVICKLVNTLIMCCRDSDHRIRDLLGECLGELGAIDPGRFEVQNFSAKDESSQHVTEVDDDRFAVELVSELSRAYLAAVETRVQDCSSYAIQEILQIYGFREESEGPASSANSLWSQLSDEVKEIAAPLLHSCYFMSEPAFTLNVPQPIYCSRKGKTFSNWVRCWASHLLSQVTQEKASRVFLACSSIMRHDVNVALFLLPRILICIVIGDRQPDSDEAREEILTVLNYNPEVMPTGTDLHHMSVQTVFSVLEYLRKWVANNSLPNEKTNSEDRRYDLCNVQEFLEKIPNESLALSSFKSQAYTRALMHLEVHIKEYPACLQDKLSFLQKLYGALDEPDGIAGVISVRQDSSLQDMILSHENTGQLQDALSCFERAVQCDDENVSNHEGLLRCMMGLDQPHMALTYANGLLTRRQDWMSNVNHYRVEAAWKLASWDDLRTYLKCDNGANNSWGVGVGNVLMNVKLKETDFYEKQMMQLRCDQIAPLSAASMENGSYQRGYEFLVRLHMLNEAKKCVSTFMGNGDSNGLEQILHDWKGRTQLIQSSTRCLEPLMNLRRVLLGLASEQVANLSDLLEQEVGRCWLQSAKIARKCGHLQRAYGYLLTANRFQLPEVYLEQAKWHWQKGEQESAILCLNKVVREHYSDLNPKSNGTMKMACAKTKLLLSRYTEESGNLESSAMIQMYKEVLDIYPEWEDGHFYLARYLDRILSNPNERFEMRGDLVVSIIKHFGSSLLYGCRNVFQSMPRLLSLWLDFSASLMIERERCKTSRVSHTVESMEKTVVHIHKKLISTLVQQLPPYLFLTTFSQIVSRICHSHPDVFSYLKGILAKLLATYPQQTIWMMMSVAQSSNPTRVVKCQEIFDHFVSLAPKHQKFLSDVIKLTDRLLELCYKVIPRERKTFSIQKETPRLISLLDDPNFSNILLPIQSLMTVKLPSGPSNHPDYQPFPRVLITIHGIKDVVEMLQSLQRPKKITLVGSDGNMYTMMCKPNDDLRKDAKLMEFNSVVNTFLLRDTESRKRQLHIRTYAVVPLNEECGFIEWVPNLSSFRHILMSAYKNKGIAVLPTVIRSMAVARNATLEHKVDVFRNKFLPIHPAVFGEWFLKSFPDPTAWYLARLSYARTAAVMSMVGYILGLGDRHGENILVDSSCGDVVHVDFNCLFNKGETFDWPELVPFRLTHNMVEAMGPLGYEGVYRKSCEVSLRVMRKQRDTLLSVLKPFVHDPLLEFGKGSGSKSSRGKTAEMGETISEKAKSHVQDIDLRLEGRIKSKMTKALQSSFPLSIEGQVNYLILEATSEKNLAQMYIGWSAYM